MSLTILRALRTGAPIRFYSLRVVKSWLTFALLSGATAEMFFKACSTPTVAARPNGQTSGVLRKVCVGLARALVAVAAAGCTSRGVAPLKSPEAQLTPDGGVIVLKDEDGSAIPIAASSSLRFRAQDGSETESFRAALLCRAQGGLLLRRDTAEECRNAAPLIAYDDIAAVVVENQDRAAETALITGVAAVAVVVVVVIIAVTSSKDSAKGNSSSKSESGASPRASSSSSAPARTRTRPTSLLAPAAERATRIVADAVLSEAVERARPTPRSPLVFSETDDRRTTIRGLVSADLGLSAFTPRNGATSSARGGVRLFDFLDLTTGARGIEGGTVADSPRFVPTLGVGLNGMFPRARWLALALGAEIGTGSALDVYFAGMAGLRFAPISTLWVGVFPLHPSYAAWSADRRAFWTALSTLDVTFAF